MAAINPELQTNLGVASADYLAVLSAAEQQQLAALIAETRKQHHHEIMQAVDNTAEHIPRLLRGQFRKLFN